MIALFAVAALANPPRGEVIIGWAGNTETGYGFATVQPALIRSETASLVLRATVSQMYYTFLDGDVLNEVDSPGVSFGPGFVYEPGDFAFGAGVGLGARHSTRTVDQLEDRNLELEATMSGSASWRPNQRASIYTMVSFTAANPYLWARAGAMHPIIPLTRRDTAVALWLGLEGTSSGNYEARILEVGPVAELPIRDLGAVLSVRGGVAFQEIQGEIVRRPTLGAGLYWSF